MTEVLFYHLEGRPLEQVLPRILELCVARGWRTVVETGSPERRDALDAHLWTYRDESFLPHGTRADGEPEGQPVYLTAENDNPNSATVRVLADRAPLPADFAAYDRIVLVFDGNDPEAREQARNDWRTVTRAEGHQASYWRQDAGGRWSKVR